MRGSPVRESGPPHGCPVELKTKSGRALKEGRDYETIVDRRMHERLAEGVFEVAGEPPAVKLLPAAKLADGDVVLASYHHAVSIYDGQVPASLSEKSRSRSSANNWWP